MRNLAVYPITTEESVRTLYSVAEDIIKTEVIGDTRPVILTKVALFLAQNEAAFAEFLEANSVPPREPHKV